MHVAREHVDDAALHAERTWSFEFAGVLVATLFEHTRHVAKLAELYRESARHVHELLACMERQRLVDAGIGRRQHAQQCPRACDDDSASAFCQHVRCFEPARYGARVARFSIEWQVIAFCETEYALVAQVCRDVARECDCSIFACNDDKRALWVMGVSRCDHERSRR